MAQLSDYKPQVSLAETFKVDENLPDEELTFDLLKKLVFARTIQDVTFLAMGKMLKIVRDRKLYLNLDFENFSQFLASEELSFSREKAYVYIRTYELFVEKLEYNPDEIGKMGVVRLMMLAPVVKGMEKEEAIAKIESLKDTRYGDFIRQIKEETNKDGKPTVYWSEQDAKWIINYFEDTTVLMPIGKFKQDE